MHNRLLRIIDANLNRSQEGLRVCEDILRFILNDKKLYRSFKSLRHKLAGLVKKIYEKKSTLLKSRNIKMDIGKKTTHVESRRRDIKDVFCANIQRVKESLRVLEEITKLLDREISQNFKKARFRVYEIEKKASLKLEIILHY